MIVELALFAQLAGRCAPHDPVETLAAVAQTESGFNPLAIRLNGPDGRAISPDNREAAVAIATDFVRQGRSVDLGLMQVNSGNLGVLGLTVAEAFDPCINIAAGARILREGYAIARRGEPDPQRALRVAFSRYNTGNSERGFANGYVRNVQAAAEIVVPAIRLRGEGANSPRPAAVPEFDDDPDAPPAWDVWATAARIRQPQSAASTSHTAAAASGDAADATSTLPSRTAE